MIVVDLRLRQTAAAGCDWNSGSKNILDLAGVGAAFTGSLERVRLNLNPHPSAPVVPVQAAVLDRFGDVD
jgi:hypothetical protein